MDREGLLDDSTYINELPFDSPLRHNENVFAFNLMAASLELSQMIAYIFSPIGISDLGSQIYHFVGGKLYADFQQCIDNCYFTSIVGMGDHCPEVFIDTHPVAEAQRLSRQEVTTTPLWSRIWSRLRTIFDH
ncbi:MAG: hypothetical protein M0Z41_13280 [Peptococcaceae bacterium]|nr:hypothetical protein [Peptococcaceae bacterium]